MRSIFGAERDEKSSSEFSPIYFGNRQSSFSCYFAVFCCFLYCFKFQGNFQHCFEFLFCFCSFQHLSHEGKAKRKIEKSSSSITSHDHIAGIRSKAQTYIMCGIALHVHNAPASCKICSSRDVQSRREDSYICKSAEQNACWGFERSRASGRYKKALEKSTS